jgi:hypothetical protein
MNYKKLDAALSAVVEVQPLSEEANLSVFIRTVEPPDAEQRSELESLGVYGASPRGRVFSAQLSPHAVSTLSEKPWVRLLTLAQDLKPLA